MTLSSIGISIPRAAKSVTIITRHRLRWNLAIFIFLAVGSNELYTYVEIISASVKIWNNYIPSFYKGVVIIGTVKTLLHNYVHVFHHLFKVCFFYPLHCICLKLIHKYDRLIYNSFKWTKNSKLCLTTMTHNFKWVKIIHICLIWDQTFTNLDT